MAFAVGNRDRGGGFLGWFKNLFSGKHAEPDWKDKLQMIVIMIRDQQEKLDVISDRMKKRAEELFNRVVEQQKKSLDPNVTEDERRTYLNLARTFAEEIREIKAILRAIAFTKVSLEKVAQRLETVKELKDFRDIILPITGILKGIKQEISPIFPSIGQALDEISRNISELAYQTSAGIRSLPSDIGPIPGSQLDAGLNDEVSKILNESMIRAENEILRAIPEPLPLTQVRANDIVKETSKTAGRDTTYYEANIPKKTTTTSTVRKQQKPVDVVVESGRVKARKSVQSDKVAREVEQIALPSRGMSMARLEQLVLDEIKVNRGRFNVDEFARKYGVSKDRVFDALQSLARKGKIRVARK